MIIRLFQRYRLILSTLAAVLAVATILAFYPSHAYASIAFDATSHGTGTSVTPLTWSHTTTGSNLVLVVGVGDEGTGNVVTAVTYNGVALSPIATSSQGTSARAQLWYLLNPATGTHTISVTFTGTNFENGVAVSFTGVLGGLDSSNTGNNTTSAISTTDTTSANNAEVIDVVEDVEGFSQGLTVNAAQTQKQNVSSGNSGQIGMSIIGPVSPAGAQAMKWTDNNNSPHWAQVVAAFSPSAAATTYDANSQWFQVLY